MSASAPLPLHFRSVPEMIARQVELTPESVALEHPGGCLSYRELDQRAGELAGRLRQQLPERGCNVCLHLPRSADLLIAVLGCWRAGHAYVPLPPDTPPDRRDHILRETQCALILTSRTGDDHFGGSGVPVLAVNDALLPPTYVAPAPAPPSAVAYIMYTSGSTGTPKGVVIEHEALAGYIAFARDRYVTTDAPVFPLFTTFGFDLTVTSLFTPLTCGGRLLIYPESRPGTPDLAVLDVMAEDRCDVIKLTPAHLGLLRGKDYRGHRLRTLIVGGEQLSSRLAWEMSGCLPARTEIVNEYGPTEATVGCIVHRYDKRTDHADAVPIGLPTDNTSVWLFDHAMQPTVAGEVGELYLGGSGLARGYWLQPELTAQRFVAHPTEPGTRLYRTGDRARVTLEGVLEFIGRTDRQVKWRGFRIELDAIERVLSSVPGVTAAAVDLALPPPANGQDPNQRQLTAYYVADRGTTQADLRYQLQRQLPAYSIPQTFVALTNLPLTPAGKIDRRALAGRAGVAEPPPGGYEAPQGEIETILSELWSEVLDRRPIGRHDAFLDLGGHSLTAIRLAARITEAFELDLPLPMIFELSTVAEQGAYLEATLLRLLADSGKPT
ncbi:non-ribosomal peptide synthetase [Lewinella sp. JB7]|uniref:non-ribosomal peptide synthetase n=1 Tax=Lewinella sp. JB7 TaxID=2962887 RepID=UPI0020C98B1F|nr:non-ribosomal peptide synthetase [Lewinella sp. JB7]MCP9234766.1 non-ribosomal peptide synthetase [Lewinella sp. JB7]